MSGLDVADEFETIRKLFAPLAHPQWGRGLGDDVAALPGRAGFDLVLTKDLIVEGVHFLPDDPLDTVARKLLRVNLSDLAAKGAEPFGYLLGCGWSRRCGWPERELFVEGLRDDQSEFGIELLGGDTVVTPGPAFFSATLFGWMPRGHVIGRNSARPGDLVFVTGNIGDGWLGLQAAQGKLKLEPDRLASLVKAYRTPTPRFTFAPMIRELANAALDVSDGLIADLGHIARESGVAIELDLEKTPMSGAAHAWFDGRVDQLDALVALATGGDDYEIAFTASAMNEDILRREAERRHLRLTLIGQVTTGQGVHVRHLGQPVEIERSGFVHR